MSLESIMQMMRDAFDMLNRPQLGGADKPAPRPRLHESAPRRDETDVPTLPKDGFTEEAIPWMGAVHHFALRLTRGDDDAASDLVQETFLKAYRSWHRFDRGTNCRSWLFTICKNTHLRLQEKAQTRREISETDLDVDLEALAVDDVHNRARRQKLDASLFDSALDERVVAAIDALPDEYRDTLVLSDLGDLNYSEISEVLGIPTGTVKSRLFRARRRLQENLIDYAAEAGLFQDESA
jgi:RNA polymerase sigma-70 factor (ECF subfamily)